MRSVKSFSYIFLSVTKPIIIIVIVLLTTRFKHFPKNLKRLLTIEVMKNNI